ncbi:hypothetical protein GCM10018954_073540 [Kutzneria kofuensis]
MAAAAASRPAMEALPAIRPATPRAAAMCTGNRPRRRETPGPVRGGEGAARREQAREHDPDQRTYVPAMADAGLKAANTPAPSMPPTPSSTVSAAGKLPAQRARHTPHLPRCAA